MIGRRLPDAVDKSRSALMPGDYVKIEGIGWYCMAPDGSAGSLRNHTIEEHPDGTITVTPSILISKTDGQELWHGFLEKGVWRSI